MPLAARQPDRRDDRPREVEWTCSSTRQKQVLSPCRHRERTNARCLAARSSDAREFSWPVCASQVVCAHPSSGDVVWQVEFDRSCGTDGAVSTRGWCAGDAGQCLSLFIHSLRWSQICCVYVRGLDCARARTLLATQPRWRHGHGGWPCRRHGCEVNRLRARGTAPGSEVKVLYRFRSDQSWN